MKKFILPLLIVAFSFVSCGDTSGNTDGENGSDSLEELGQGDMNMFSLVPYGLNFSILLPEVESQTGASLAPVVEHEDGDYLWYLNIGNNFQLVIEDYGKEKNKVAEEKKYLEGQSSVFVFEYLVDEPNVIMYKRELHADQGGKPSYHCYGELNVDGYTLVLRTNQDGTFKPIVLDMVTIIKSAKVITKA